MKKIIMVLTLLMMIFTLSSCKSLREAILAAPDEMEIPEGSSIAICTKADITYTHIYQGDGIYLYYIDNVLQGDEQLDSIQEQAYLHGESVENYLMDEYGLSLCTIEDYVD